MAKNAYIQVRVQQKDKEQAKELFARYGLNFSTAFNLFIEHSLRENKLPFGRTIVPEQTSSVGKK